MPRPDRIDRLALPACLAVQAALLFGALNRLPAWGDEHASLSRAALDVPHLLGTLRSNVHPPLYSLLLQAWLALPWSAAPLVAARALSATLVLLTTLALDRTWLQRLDSVSRRWFLALWAAAPALILYGRMARSYALQLLLAVLALWWGTRAVRTARLSATLLYAATALLLLYSHYLPGAAIVVAVAGAAAWRAATERSRASLAPLLLPVAVIAAGYAPWMPWFDAAAQRVWTTAAPGPFGAPILDGSAALAYAWLSFTGGECLPWWNLPLASLAAGGAAVLLWHALRRPPADAGILLVTAVIAFAGAAAWVSPAFVAARLLFLLPFFLLALVRGGRRAPRWRPLVGAAMIASAVAGAIAYHLRSDFLNPAYVIPTDAIAAEIRAAGFLPPRVALDHLNINLSPVLLDLPPGTTAILVTDAATADAAARLAAPGGPAPVWFVRAAHDGSPQQLTARVEAAWASRCTLTRHGFAPYPAIDRVLLRLLGRSSGLQHVVELVRADCPFAQ